MKKFVSIMFALMMVLGLMIPVMSGAESADGHDKMIVSCSNGNKLNVRDMPSAKIGKLLYRVENGKTLTILHDETTPAGWAKVRYGSKEAGYVMTKFLRANKSEKFEKLENEADFKAVTPYIATAKARGNHTTESVGLRVAPTKNSDAIRRLYAGDRLQVIEVGSDWSKVVDLKTGSTGYVANDYIRVA